MSSFSLAKDRGEREREKSDKKGKVEAKRNTRIHPFCAVRRVVPFVQSCHIPFPKTPSP
jgi:hypothetical protein